MGIVGEAPAVAAGVVYTAAAVGCGYVAGWKSAVFFYAITDQQQEQTWTTVCWHNHELVVCLYP